MSHQCHYEINPKFSTLEEPINLTIKRSTGIDSFPQSFLCEIKVSLLL